MNKNKNIFTIKTLEVFIQILLYISIAMLGAASINFIFYILRITFFNYIFIDVVSTDLNWLIDLIQIKQNSFKKLTSNNLFLLWYPQNLILLGILSYFIKILTIYVFTYTAIQIKKIFTALNNRELFTIKNFDRLRKMGQLIMLIAIVNSISSLKIQFSWFLFSILLFVLSEIHKHGIKLENDNQLTI